MTFCVVRGQPVMTEEYSEINALREYIKSRIEDVKKSEPERHPDGVSRFLLGYITGFEDIERGFTTGRYKRMVTMHNKKVQKFGGE